MDPSSNMPCWYFEKKELRNTPSIQDGIDYETECRYRKEGARFIIDTGTKMDLGYNTMATGVVYFHRFYMYHSFRNFPRYVTACCCLFLAGKVEETPKKCKDIIKTAKSLLTDQKFATFGEDPREEVMTLERILLQTIKFDLQVEHPYSFLLKYAKSLKGDKAKLHKMVQMAWTFVNDSLCTMLSLQWEPEVIAVALMYLAGKLSKFEVVDWLGRTSKHLRCLCTTLSLQWEPEVIAVALMYLAGKLSKFEVVDWLGRTSKHLRWWDMFVEDITMDLLEDICHQVLDLYSQNNPQPLDSPPMVRHPPPALATPTPALAFPAHNSPAGPPPALSAKPIKSEAKLNSNGEKIPTVTGGVVSVTDGKAGSEVYGYPGYTQPPPSSTFPPAFTTTRPPPAQFPPTYSSTAPTSHSYPPGYYSSTNHSQPRPPY